MSAASRYPLLERVDSPADLRRLPMSELPALVSQLRAFMIESVSRTGGHLASSLGAVELAVALHYVFNTPDDALVWDVGHQAYAHKILTGRRRDMAWLRTYGGISGFPRRSESPYDSFGVGHSSTSVSAALGMAVADSLAGRSERWHIAVIGDGALTGGMACEALNHAGVYKEKTRLLIILNDNDCSISPAVGALSGNLGRLVSTSPVWRARELGKQALRRTPFLLEMAKRMEKQTVNFLSPAASLFLAFDLNYFGPIDGHDLPGLIRMLRNLRRLKGPVVLHVKTRKGRGYPAAEADPTRYHGVPRFDPARGLPEPEKGSPPTYTQVFGDWLCDMAAADPTLYAITPAMREGSGLVEFSRRFPERYRDVAIAEQHAVTYAAGLACAGLHPVVAIYSTFAQRAYDQIVHDVALQDLPVTLALDRAGLVGPDGATHHGAFDLAYLRSLPNLVIMAPSDEREARLALTTAFRHQGPSAVRYPRGPGPGMEPGSDLSTVPLGSSRELRRCGAPAGRRVALLVFGAMVWRLRELADTLDASLIDMRFVKPLDGAAVARAAADHDLLVTAEEGALAGGAGSAVLEELSRRGLTPPVLTCGLPDRFLEHGDTESLLSEAGLAPAAIGERIAARLAELSQGRAAARRGRRS